MIRFLASLFVVFALSQSITAQDIVNYIPDHVPIVVSLNIENAQKKVTMSELTELGIYKSLETNMSQSEKDKEIFDLVSKFYENPEAVGLSWEPRSYAYFHQKDSFMISSFIWKVTDEAKLQASFPEQMGTPKKSGKIKYIISDTEDASDVDIAIGWTKDVVTVQVVKGDNSFVHNSIPYTDTARYEKIEKLQAKYTETLRKVAIRQAEEALKPAQSPITKSANYQTFSKNKYDFGFWMNLEKIGGLLEEQNQFPVPMQAQRIQQLANKLSGLPEGFFHVFVHLNKGEARIETQSFMVERLDKMAKKIYEKPFDESLFKYTKGKDALFYGGMAMDLAQLSDFTEEYYRMALEGDSLGDIILGTWDVVDIAIDQEALTGLFSGDFLMSITGVKKVESTYTSYEYDDNFNAVEVPKTKENTLPVFTALAKIGDKANMQKIINLAEMTKIIEKKGDYYIIPKADEIGDAYVRIKDNVLIFTNDADIITGKYKNGVPKSEQLSEADKQLLRSNSNVYNLNAQNLLKKIEEVGEQELSEKNKQQLQLLKDNIEYVRIQGTDTKNNYKSEVIISFKDKSQHFLKQVGILLEEFEKL